MTAERFTAGVVYDWCDDIMRVTDDSVRLLPAYSQYYLLSVLPVL